MTPLHERLRLLKASKGLSFKQLGDIIGTSPDVAKNYLLGRTEMPISLAAKMCDALSVDITWLIFGGEDMNRPTLTQLTKETENEGASLESLRGTFDLLTNLWLDVTDLQTKFDELQKELNRLKESTAPERA